MIRTAKMPADFARAGTAAIRKRSSRSAATRQVPTGGEDAHSHRADAQQAQARRFRNRREPHKNRVAIGSAVTRAGGQGE